MYCYGANRRAAKPARLLLSGLRGRQAAALQNVSGVDDWKGCARDARPLEAIFATSEERASLVYLTADSDEMLEALDPAASYVVGGFVDRNRHKGATRDKAARLGLRTARLPISDAGPVVLDKTANSVLAINHVVALLVGFQSSGDWAVAARCLPGRKRTGAEGEGDGD